MIKAQYFLNKIKIQEIIVHINKIILNNKKSLSKYKAHLAHKITKFKILQITANPDN